MSCIPEAAKESDDDARRSVSPEIAMKLCVNGTALKLHDIQGVDFVKLVKLTRSPDIQWLIKAIDATQAEWAMLVRSHGCVLNQIKDAITSARGAHTKFTNKIDDAGMVTCTLNITVREYDVRVGNTKWPLYLESTPININWLVKTLKSDVRMLRGGALGPCGSWCYWCQWRRGRCCQ